MLMESACKFLELELIQAIDSDSIAKSEAMKQRTLIVIDDLYDEVSHSRVFEPVFFRDEIETYLR